MINVGLNFWSRRILRPVGFGKFGSARLAENAGSVSTARTSACLDAAHTSCPLRNVTLVIGPGSVVDPSPWNGHTRGGNVSMLTP